MNRTLLTILAASILISSLAPARGFAAADVDAKTRDLLIEKLTRVHLNLAPQEPSRVGVALRLADLLSERARLKAMADLDSGAARSVKALADRKTALVLYSGVIDRVPAENKGKVLAQVGHLHEMVGDETQAIASYQRILSEATSVQAKAEAHLSLAEVHFKKRDYKMAQTHYQAVVESPQAASRGLAAYRTAWCQFNQGELEPAINGLQTVLKSPELLTRSGAAGVVSIDQQFAEEVSRDLATFIARRAVTVADAQMLFDLSPENAKIANATYLAAELERLGQTGPSIEIWRFVESRQKQPVYRLESLVRLAQLEMQVSRRPEALKDFESALALWTSMNGCQDAACAELKSRMRKFVIEWNRIEKKAPPPELLSTYMAYLDVFPADQDMRLWAAQVASQLKDYDAAMASYKISIEALANAAKSGSAEATAVKEARTTLEAATLGAVETAELSKKPEHLDLGYALYLNHSPERKKALEVQYQKAHLIYEKGDHAAAAQALREVALSSETGPLSVKEQAADLALDSLVLAKNDSLIETWAREFAKSFPSKKEEFLKLARTSVMNQTASLAPSGTVPKEGLETAWNVLARYPVAEASAAEQATYWKNRLVLAEKLERFSEAREAADALLRVSAASEVDKQFALSRKAWLAELVLDFESALIATEKMPPASFPQTAQKWLKLGLYADLAARDSRAFYERFMKETTDESGRRAVALRLVRESATPVKELDRQRAWLASDAETLARVALETFAKTNDIEVLKKAAKDPKVAATASGRSIGRVLLFTEFEPLKARLESSKIDSSNQKKLAQSLKSRLQLIETLEKIADRAVRLQDWTAQLVTLDRLARESDRFYQEILQLPVPAGLAPEEEQEYLTLLSQQASPHQVRASDIGKKVAEFWSGEDTLEAIKAGFASEHGPLRNLLAQDLRRILEAAPDAKKPMIASILEMPEKSIEVPSRDTLEAARKAVRENPMSRESVQQLLGLEKQAGREAMVAYLETRLATMEAKTAQEVKP